VRVLVTGGAGFIGSHLVPLLAAHGHDVVVLDNLSPQIHEKADFPTPVRDVAECVRADVRDADAVHAALRGVEVVVHLAAETGTGQSMYQMRHYSDVNVLGTATLLDAMAQQDTPVRRLVLASSRAVYGEGQYTCPQDGTVFPPTRSASRLALQAWELTCPICGGPAHPVPTHEDARVQPQSIYASNKQTQEQLVTIAAQARGTETVILRYQNVYGPGQALNNPYTGVICVFFGLLVEARPILLFEDGLPTRDFVAIDDVAAATLAAVEADLTTPATINVGTGRQTTIRAVAETLAAVLGIEPTIEVTQKTRRGDIRHCYADIRRLETQLGYTPRISFTEGITRFALWAKTQEAMIGQISGRFEQAQRELVARKLFR
jgi:dTDP-L-rhamnose 4-epimerase